MKFQAHPLVVAAALGLVGPGALAEDGEDEEREERQARSAGEFDGPDLESFAAEAVAVDVTAEADWTWSPGEVPDAEAFQRVELAWKETVGRS